MDPAEKPEKRIYNVLLFVKVNQEYYTLDKQQRAELNNPHVTQLSEHLKYVSILSLQGTGLSRDVLVEVLESESLTEIERMIETYKAGSKAQYGIVENVMIMEKVMERKMTGRQSGKRERVQRQVAV
ncbi:hypothetical protein CN221_29340 [Sinorhizobium meliloti]|uniref:hypothetical protein n=1 Tax=Rhizobium meliloti TaxID=382 RepID=UPI000FE03B5F|nr:hypothetical protein [Sinorhizobium meliloti]RVG87158.1 hypothetical protein CN221_29340 [Sinorhizobium meliloti]RVH58426.1 hypothetical protein CN209_28290 [Sinorhizobium meliloti]